MSGRREKNVTSRKIGHLYEPEIVMLNKNFYGK